MFANMVTSFVPAYNILFAVMTVVAALIEGRLLRRVLRWSAKRAFLTALVANAITILGGIRTAFVALFPSGVIRDGARWHADSVTLATSVWACYRTWWLPLLGVWLGYYLVTVLVEANVIYFSSKMPGPELRFRRATRAAALANAVTCVLVLPLWMLYTGPDFGDFELVHRTKWLPAVDETFVYDHPDGSRWVATTQGRQLGRLADLPDNQVPKDSFEESLAWPLHHVRDEVSASTLHGVLRVYRAAEEGSCRFAVSGGFGYDLRCRYPNVLPGGRYVLFECSGEIMVLDIEERKGVSLFPGRNPVALASLEPRPRQDEPPAE